MKPYYQDASVTIYHGDCREASAWLAADVMVTDPPYGIAYESGHDGALDRSITGDSTTELRDFVLAAFRPKPSAVFSTWRCALPAAPKIKLVWEKPTIGMGDLSFPWGASYEVVWIFGDGWAGQRSGAVLRGRTIPTWNSGAAKRVHPHEKPEDVLGQIIAKAPSGVICDPFMGSGSTLVAAKSLGRRAIGVEIDERYCEIAARRCSQEVLDLGAA
jgi:DNA modification methylase